MFRVLNRDGWVGGCHPTPLTLSHSDGILEGFGLPNLLGGGLDDVWRAGAGVFFLAGVVAALLVFADVFVDQRFAELLAQGAFRIGGVQVIAH